MLRENQVELRLLAFVFRLSLLQYAGVLWVQVARLVMLDMLLVRC